MKIFALFIALALLCPLAACESTSAPAPDPSLQAPGSPIGNSGVHVSGDVQAGGTSRMR